MPTTGKGGQADVNVGAGRRGASSRRRRCARGSLAGEDFAKLAAEVSTSPSKANGGLIGPINLAEVSASLQKLIETMKAGDVTEPMRTPRGYQILKLETLTPAAVAAVRERRDQIADKVHDARQQAEVRKYLAKLRGQAIIEWKNDELKKVYEKQVAVETRRRRLTNGHRCRPHAWYAIWTRSRHEQVVREQLERKRFEAFLPTITRWSRWKDRKKKIDWPLFPGYCFARFDSARARCRS